MTDFDKRAFLDWLDSEGAYTTRQRVQDEWPEFYELGYHKNFNGITVSLDRETGEITVPTRDYRDVVIHGVVFD